MLHLPGYMYGRPGYTAPVSMPVAIAATGTMRIGTMAALAIRDITITIKIPEKKHIVGFYFLKIYFYLGNKLRYLNTEKPAL